jgi:hypothetical protein
MQLGGRQRESLPDFLLTLNQTTMSIQEELDNVREQKFRKDMQSVYDKLNEVCLELCDMRLEEFTEIMEDYGLAFDDDDPEKWINEPPDWGEHSEYCNICDCITTFSADSPYGTCDCS